MDSNTTSNADASTGSRIRYLRHPILLLTRAADEERNFRSSSSRHPGAAVARKTRAIGRELLRTVMTFLAMLGCRNVEPKRRLNRPRRRSSRPARCGLEKYRLQS